MSTQEDRHVVGDGENTRQLRHPCLCCQAAGRTRPADVGRTVCFYCCNRILGWLADIELAVFTLALGSGGDGRRAPGFGSRSPARDDVLSALDPRSRPARMVDPHLDDDGHARPIIGTLAAVVAALAEAQGHPQPSGVETVTSMGRYIRRSQPYWSGCDWVDDFASELRDLSGIVKRLQGEHRPKRIGTCPSFVKGVECGEALFAPPDGDTIRCRKCKREWPREQWLRLGLLIESA